jgi:hypothetical protein
MQLLWEKKKDRKNDDESRSEKRSWIIIRAEEWSKERSSIEKWKEKWDFYEGGRMIKIIMFKWEMKWEGQLLWEKKNNQKNDDELKSELWHEIIMRKKIQKNDDELRIENGSSKVMREEGWKERW